MSALVALTLVLLPGHRRCLLSYVQVWLQQAGFTRGIRDNVGLPSKTKKLLCRYLTVFLENRARPPQDQLREVTDWRCLHAPYAIGVESHPLSTDSLPVCATFYLAVVNLCPLHAGLP